MHRSGSKKGGMDELCVGRTAPPPQAGGGERAAAVAAELGEEIALLPRYDPRSDMARKEAARRRAAEGAVHIIPSWSSPAPPCSGSSPTHVRREGRVAVTVSSPSATPGV
ncbi:unnamed protein product [Spirodela intermedia]|uniref:Uncharacterized protein n=1 Tax=Spirodela intermedia TaxID=51605 RepID=A0A7I8JPL5_SPIIN|nr:unnamed protein product [Spirodela intermedia]CAA6671735.1 unnamed protein product [Spirodela intermedia]